jgi:NAD(P)-dependent dehydrogenase (short-subunit alcohol dehydrogenase family)
MSAFVLVTGANKGLGKEVARQLGRRGMTVLLGSRDADRGQAAAAELRAEGIDVEFIAIDVTSDESVADAVAHIGQVHGRLDVLINNAGILRRIPALETTVEKDVLVNNAAIARLGQISDIRSATSTK